MRISPQRNNFPCSKLQFLFPVSFLLLTSCFLPAVSTFSSCVVLCTSLLCQSLGGVKPKRVLYVVPPKKWGNRLLTLLSLSPHPFPVANQKHMIYHFIPDRMTIIKKTRDSKCWWRYGETGTLLHSWWECKSVQPLWKTMWRHLKHNKKNRTTVSFSNLTSGYL